MPQWDKVQRMQLEQQQLEARFRAEVDTLSEQLRVLREARAALVESRDLARSVAMRLEQENAALGGSVCAVCAQVLVPVPVIGDAT